jgi:mRNA-degrading endonuclease toxin of MazEF toxin-antitoxin module
LRRGDIVWGRVGTQRRPYLVLTRNGVAGRAFITVVEITTTIRQRPFEAPVPDSAGLPRPCVVNADGIQTVRLVDLDPEPIGSMNAEAMAAVDTAIHYALQLSCR